jgi:hypothetical protein
MAHWRINYIVLDYVVLMLAVMYIRVYSVCIYMYIYLFIAFCVCIYIYIYIYIQGVTGGMCETSGECSLGQTIPI